MSAFLDIVATAVALLKAGPALAGGFVHSGRSFPLPEEQSQGVFVRLVRSIGEAPFAGDSRVDWQTDLAITVLARAAAGVDADTATDALLQAVYVRLCTAPPPTNADGWTVQPAINWDAEEADQTLGGAQLRVRVQHRTASGDLTAA